jgi:hypothetical protein
VFIRYFCHVGGPSKFAAMGFDYFVALQATGIPIRVIPINPADVSGSLWDDYTDELTREVPKEYVNIICGDNGDLVRLFTIGVKNVAITATFNQAPTHNEVAALKDYDAILCPSDDEAQILRLLDLLAVHVAPDAITLARLLRGL